MWLKGFTTYGWIGGFSYIVLVVWTLAASFPLLFKQRPWTPIVQCAFAVFVGHVLIHNVIDNDHWRHLFLLYGMLWGAVAAERAACAPVAPRGGLAARRRPPCRSRRAPRSAGHERAAAPAAADAAFPRIDASRPSGQCAASRGARGAVRPTKPQDRPAAPPCFQFPRASS